MFTGLITATTTVTAIEHHDNGGARLSVAPCTPSLAVGNSIALDGCCLTVAACNDDQVTFDLSHETLQRTTFATLKPGRHLNVEQPLRFGAPLHGHLVSGHVDTTTAVIATHGATQRGRELTIAMPPGYDAQLFPQAAVTLNGVSLTITAVNNHAQPPTFTVCLIPETCHRTNLGTITATQQVNFESDMLGKYITRHVAHWPGH